MLTYKELVESAIDDFKDYFKNGDLFTEYHSHGIINKIADSHVPTEYSDLLEVAMSNLLLACTEPEL